MTLQLVSGGIQANVEPVTSGRLGDIINAGEYDLFSWGWIPDPDPDSDSDSEPDGRPRGRAASQQLNAAIPT